MGVNKVIYYGEVLVDMSQVTVTPETLGKGVTALDAKGDLITGSHECEETEPKLQSKTVTPTTSLQTVNPDSGYDGLSKVTVNAMPTATQATPSITVSSAGLITASATQSAGYVASGTKSATKQLTTQAAKTITPSTSSQTAVASGRYTTGTITVAAIPDTYIQPSGTLNVTANGTHDVKNYASVSVNVPTSGGGGSGGTCSVEIIVPAHICVFGWGTYERYMSPNNGSTWVALPGTFNIPSIDGGAHILGMYTKYVFPNLPVGSVFTFYYPQYKEGTAGIIGAQVSGDIEFSLANHSSGSVSVYAAAMCKCNGSGTITITLK